jgi:hypothetical protein
LDHVGPVQSGVYAAKARGLALCAITIGAAYVYYLAIDADDAIPPAAADAIVIPPVTRVRSINQPIKIIPDNVLSDAAEHGQTDRVNVPHKVSPPLYAEALAAQATKLEAEPRSMLDRAWAPPEMLVPSKDTEQPPQTGITDPIVLSDTSPVSEKPGQVSAALVAVEDPSSAIAHAEMPSAAETTKSAVPFERDKAVSEAVPEPEVRTPPTPRARKAIKRKPRVTRHLSRRSASTFGMSFDEIERSLSSWFD